MRCRLIPLIFFSTSVFAQLELSPQLSTSLPTEAVVVVELSKNAPLDSSKKPTQDEKEAEGQDSKEIQQQNKNFQNAILKTFLSIFGLISLILLTIWFLRRLSHNRHTFGMKSHSLQILEKRLLSPKTTLYLMEVDGKKIVFAESMMEVKVLYTESPTSTALSPVPYTELK